MLVTFSKAFVMEQSEAYLKSLTPKDGFNSPRDIELVTHINKVVAMMDIIEKHSIGNVMLNTNEEEFLEIMQFEKPKKADHTIVRPKRENTTVPVHSERFTDRTKGQYHVEDDDCYCNSMNYSNKDLMRK